MKIDLSPIDYYFYRPHLYTIQFAFEYENKMNTEKLKNSLRKLVESMPIMGARLIKISQLQIGLELGNSIPIREQFMDRYPLPSESLFDPVTNIEGEALIKVLVSQFKDRSFVGFSFSHILGDGAAFFLFLENLVRLAANKPVLPVDMDRSLLTRHCKDCINYDLFESTGYIQPRPANPKNVVEETIHYSEEKIKGIKTKLKALGYIASTNDIIMADLAKTFFRSIPYFKSKFIIRCPVDYRITLELGTRYFGNAVRDAISIFAPEELESMDFISIIQRIRQSILAVNFDSVKKSLSALNTLRERYGVDTFQNLGCPGLLVSNISKFPVFKIDLGAGTPLAFQHASINPRLALILSHKDGFLVKFRRPVTSER